LDIVYASDNSYAMLVGVSMESLFCSNASTSEINVYVLSCGISKDNVMRLSDIANRHKRNVTIIDITESDILNNKELHINPQRWSIAAFARLITPQLLPSLSKILYLDCDTIILKSLEELWNIDLGKFMCAAVAEPFSTIHKQNVGLNKMEEYYNSGVMLINLDLWRQKNSIEEFKKAIIRHAGNVPYVDQGVLNEVFRNNIMLLAAKYNVYTEYFDFSYEEVSKYRAGHNIYSKEEINEAKRNPVIVHFVSSFLTPRPWVENSTHYYAREWERYSMATPWKNEKKWPDTPGISKKTLRSLFRYSPRPFALFIAMIVNSYVRPFLDKRHVKRY